MSANKRGGGADGIYTRFGYSPYAQNKSILRQNRIELMLQKAITELSMNRFKWEGLPETIDLRFLEMELFRAAIAVYYFDKDYNTELVVRGTGAGWINVFDNPISFNVIAPGLAIEMDGAKSNIQSSKRLPAYDRMRHHALENSEKRNYAIPIWANYTRIPDWNIVEIYASRLASLDRTIEINTHNARRNRILKGTQNTQLSVQNVARSIDQGDNVEMVTGPLEDMSWLDTVDLGVNPDSYEKLHILRTRTWNECMGLLGIDNANQDKKERLVAAEVSANDDQTNSMRYVALNARRQAAELISEIFGHEVTVEYNTVVDAQAAALAAQTNPGNDSDNKGGDE